MGEGITESILGGWFSQGEGRRERVVLATKVFGRMGEWPNQRRLSALHIRRACDESLRRLQTDHIDLYQAHWPDKDVAIEETMRAFNDLVKQGKVRIVGCSNFSGDELAEALQASKRHGLVEYTTLQPHWSLVERQKFELETYPTVKIYWLAEP